MRRPLPLKSRFESVGAGLLNPKSLVLRMEEADKGKAVIDLQGQTFRRLDHLHWLGGNLTNDLKSMGFIVDA